MQLAGGRGLRSKIASQHLLLYKLAVQYQEPLLLEFGVKTGRSTCVLLSAAEERDGKLVSVDRLDYSDVAESPCWSFMQADDMDLNAIIGHHRFLQEGADLIHVDTTHTPEHVNKLLQLWFPYVKNGGCMTFHDVDETPYKHGRRKANPALEANVRGVAEVIRAFFADREDELFLEYHFGSTGMAVMRKIGE